MVRCWLLFTAALFIAGFDTESIFAQSIADAARQARQGTGNANPYPRSQSFADAAIEATRQRNQPNNPITRPSFPSYPTNGGYPQYDWRDRRPIYPGGAYNRRCPRCGQFNCRCGYSGWNPVWNPGWNYGYAYGYVYDGITYSNYLTPYSSFMGVPYVPTLVNPAPVIPPQVNLNFNVPAVAPVMPANPPVFNARNSVADKASRLRKANEDARDRADGIIDEADELFASQSFHRARTRYSDAIKAAPDYPRAHFRLAHAYVSLNRFEDALSEYLLAMELAGGKDQFAFKLSQLYGGNPAALQSQLEFMADHALKNPNDGTMLMLIGLTLYYDQQAARALPFIERAAQIPGDWVPYAQRFLPRPPPAALK